MTVERDSYLHDEFVFSNLGMELERVLTGETFSSKKNPTEERSNDLDANFKSVRKLEKTLGDCPNLGSPPQNKKLTSKGKTSRYISIGGSKNLQIESCDISNLNTTRKRIALSRLSQELGPRRKPVGIALRHDESAIPETAIEEILQAYNFALLNGFFRSAVVLAEMLPLPDCKGVSLKEAAHRRMAIDPRADAQPIPMSALSL